MSDWRSDVLAILAHHEDRQKEHGIAHNGRPKKGVPKGWSLRDTAEELGYPLGTLSEIINVAREVKKGGLTSVISERIARLRIKESKHMENLSPALKILQDRKEK